MTWGSGIPEGYDDNDPWSQRMSFESAGLTQRPDPVKSYMSRCQEEAHKINDEMVEITLAQKEQND